MAVLTLKSQVQPAKVTTIEQKSTFSHTLRTGRMKRIMWLLADRGECSVEELSRALGVSDMTIRRDLQKLADQGQIIRTHGGASPANQVSFEFQFLKHSQENADAKRRIAAGAAAIVHDGQSVLLDS